MSTKLPVPLTGLSCAWTPVVWIVLGFVKTHSECRTSATRVRAAQRAGSSEPSSATATPASASRRSPGALKTAKTLSGMWSPKPASAACIIAR